LRASQRSWAAGRFVCRAELGFGPLSRNELKEAAAELSGNQAALIMVGEPTLDKAFDEAVTRAAKDGEADR
jgi:hypothetical protein